MSKVSYVLVDPELKPKHRRALRYGDRFTIPRVSRNTRFLSRNKKKSLRGRSFFPLFAEYWRGLTSEQKNNWKTAASEMNLNNWQLFVHDTAARKKFSFAGSGQPSELHQGMVGHLKIQAPDDEIKIKQKHKKFYWRRKKITGTKSLFEPVKINEDFMLPLKIKLNYFADLSPVNGNAFAKFFARVWHSYQGVDLKTDLEIDLDFSTEWKVSEATLTNVIGHIIGYDVFFHLEGLRGNLFFDNIKIEHSGQNWAYDPFCNKIDRELPRAWGQIAENWAGVTLPQNAFFKSTYKDF